MRLVVIADIHANLPALQAVLADAANRGVDGYLVAGDLLVGAPFPKETLDLVRSLNALVIIGNRDRYLLDYHNQTGPRDYQTGQQWSLLRWTYDQLDADDIAYLAGLPAQAVFRTDHRPSIRVVHGSLQDLHDGLLPDDDPEALAAFRRARMFPPDVPPPRLADRLNGLDEEVLICAHTHIPWKQYAGQHLVINPGSVGSSTNGDPRAHYAILETQGSSWQVTQKAIPYDLERVRAAFMASGLLERDPGFSQATLANIVTGKNVAWFFVQHIMATARGRGEDEQLGWTPETLLEAQATFPWNEFALH